MRLSDLTYKIYRASSGASSFWRWEIVDKKRLNVPLRSGYVYGTMADAKKRASAVMSALAHTGKMRVKIKYDRRE
jgi:hypothetical protein